MGVAPAQDRDLTIGLQITVGEVSPRMTTMNLYESFLHIIIICLFPLSQSRLDGPSFRRVTLCNQLNYAIARGEQRAKPFISRDISRRLGKVGPNITHVQTCYWPAPSHSSPSTRVVLTSSTSSCLRTMIAITQIFAASCFWPMGSRTMPRLQLPLCNPRSNQNM